MRIKDAPFRAVESWIFWSRGQRLQEPCWMPLAWTSAIQAPVAQRYPIKVHTQYPMIPQSNATTESEKSTYIERKRGEEYKGRKRRHLGSTAGEVDDSLGGRGVDGIDCCSNTPLRHRHYTDDASASSGDHKLWVHCCNLWSLLIYRHKKKTQIAERYIQVFERGKF